jgi:hypothetical protein
VQLAWQESLEPATWKSKRLFHKLFREEGERCATVVQTFDLVLET